MAQAFSPRFCYQPGHGGSLVASSEHRVETETGIKAAGVNTAAKLLKSVYDILRDIGPLGQVKRTTEGWGNGESTKSRVRSDETDLKKVNLIHQSYAISDAATVSG